MILANARCLFPDGIRDGLDVLVEEGRISDLRQSGYVGEQGIVDLKGSYLAPGFIDLHLHGGAGRDAMEASREAFAAICEYHATGGTTSLLLTSVTAPIPAVTKMIDAVRECRESLP